MLEPENKEMSENSICPHKVPNLSRIQHQVACGCPAPFGSDTFMLPRDVTKEILHLPLSN